MNRTVAVVVTYNRSKLLKECIIALNQSNLPLDIMIIDNASTDNTKAVVDSLQSDYKNITYFNTEKNIGGAGGFNYGIRKAYEAGYDFFWLMDDDTIVKSDTLQQLFNIIESVDNNFGWISSLALWIDGRECVMNYQDIDNEWNCDKKGILDGRLRCSGATFVSLLISKNAVSKCGLPIKEYFIWGDDTEYTHRISKEFPCYFAPKSQVIHKMNSNEGTGKFETFENPERIERMFYSIRNDFCTYKREGFIKLLKYMYRELKNFWSIILSPNSFKGKKIRIIIKGMWCGLWFNPSIEYVNQSNNSRC